MSKFNTSCHRGSLRMILIFLFLKGCKLDVSMEILSKRLRLPLQVIHFVEVTFAIYFLGDTLSLLVTNILLAKPLTLIVHSLVTITNLLLYLNIYYQFHTKSDEICDILSFLIDHDTKRPNAEKVKTLKEKEIIFVQRLMFCLMAAVSFTSISMQVRFAIKHHRRSLPSSIPIDPTNTWQLVGFCLWDLLGAINGSTASIVYQWFMSLCLRLLSLEFELAKDNLADIVGHLGLDEDFAVTCRVEDPENEGESCWVLAATNKTMYNKRLQEANQLLNKWIEHHAKIVSYSGRLKTLTSTVAFARSFNTTCLMLTIIFVTNSQNLNKALMIYAIINMVTYARLCYDGQHLITTSSSVVDEILGSNWFLFPTSFKKKLLTICLFVQSRPCQIDFGGLIPLNLETLGNVLTLSYDLVTFLQGVV